MTTPGSNVLNRALRLIKRQTFSYTAFASRTLQSNGQYLAIYAAPVTIYGSAQPVPRNLYQFNGLDFEKSYFNFYVPQNVIDVARDVSGDTMILGGVTYQCLSVTPWYTIDGWNAVLAVKI